MADYFTKLSFTLPWPKEACDWAVALHERMIELDGEDLKDTPGDDELTMAAKDLLNDQGMLPRVQLEVQQDNGVPTLWVTHDESAQTDVLCAFLDVVMARFDIKEPVFFEYAGTASKPITGAYGGGAVVITQERTHWINTNGWLDDIRSNMQKNPKNQDPLWADDKVQFARFLVACYSAIEFTPRQHWKLYEFLGIEGREAPELHDLLRRAEKVIGRYSWTPREGNWDPQANQDKLHRYHKTDPIAANDAVQFARILAGIHEHACMEYKDGERLRKALGITLPEYIEIQNRASKVAAEHEVRFRKEASDADSELA